MCAFKTLFIILARQWPDMFRKLFILLLFFVPEQDVEGAQCKKSFGWLKCRPCGRGTRCLYCNWCTGLCNNPPKSTRRKRELESGFVEVQYKLPFLEMFDDLSFLLNSDPPGTTDLDVVEIYKMTSLATREDCILCNNSTEIDQLSSSTKTIYEELELLIGDPTFMTKAKTRTEETNSIVQNLPSSLKTLVEATSSIVVKKGILISGSGGHVGDRSGSVEVLNADGTPLCSLPDLPYETWGHTQDGLTQCGGTGGWIRRQCYTFDPKTGNWILSNTLNTDRSYHTQWRINGGLLLAGGSVKNVAVKSAEFLLDGNNVATNFELKYATR